MANDKKFIAKNGFLTSDAESSFTNSTAATPTVTFTNSGGQGASSSPGSGAVIAKFAGDSDAMVITNVSGGDYFFGNNAQNNGINFYDGGGGMEFYYDGVEKFSIDSNGTTFATGHTTNGTTTTNRLLVEDNGSSSPLVVIKSDDNGPWALAIGNDTYNTTEVQGHLFYQSNDGTSYYETRGNGEYVDWRFQQHNGSTARTAMNIDAGGTIELASNNYLLWGVDSTNRPGFLGDNTNKVLQFHNNGAERMRLGGSTSSGYFGIGLAGSDPTSILHLKDSSGPGPTILLEDASGSTQTAKIHFDQSGQNTLTISTQYQSSSDDNLIQFAPADNIAMTIRGGTGSDDGNVGIGSNDPQYKLDVSGTSRVTGGLTISPGSSGHTSFELGSRSADPLPAATGSYDFKPGMRVGSYELGGINAAANIALAWTTDDISTSSPGYLAATETYVTASWSESFTVTQKGGTRWFVKVKLNDAESGNDPRLAVNGGTEYRLEYLDAVNASGEAVNDSDTWHVIDVTDDIVTGSNILKVWLAGGQKTYILAAYVFASTGIALPNEPAESTFYAHDGFGVRDRIIIDKNRDMTNINSVRFETPSTSGGNKNYFANVGTGGQDYWIMSTSNANGSIGGGKFVIGTDAVSGNNAAQTRLLIDSSGNVGIGTVTPGYRLDIRNDVAASTDLDPTAVRLYNNSDGGSAILFENAVSGKSKISFGVEGTGSSTDETYIAFETGENTSMSERMRIRSNGNVGIGDTLPERKLHVTSASNQVAVFETTATSDMAIELRNSQGSMFMGLDGSENFGIGTDWDLNGANGKFTVTSAGDIGMGTVTPNSNLHIKSTGDVKLTLETDEDSDCWINLSGATSEASIGYEPASNSLRFANAADGVTSNIRMSIEADGTIDFKGVDGGTGDNGKLERIASAYFVNSEDANISTTLSQTNGAKLYFDHNFYSDQTRFSDVFSGDGGGFAYYGGDQVNWTAMYDTENTQYAKGTWRELVIAQTKSTTGGGQALYIDYNITEPSADYAFGQFIDVDASGSGATGGDREQGGLRINFSSTTTGGDVNDEHKIYGIHVDSNITGDADQVVGIYTRALSNLSSGTTTNLIGVDAYAEADNASGTTITTAAALKGNTYIDNAGSSLGNGYGGYFRMYQYPDGGSVTSAYGVYSELELNNATAGNNYTAGYVFRAEIDNNTGRADAIGTSYMYYGNIAGTVPTNAWGVYILDSLPNYFSGNVRIGATQTDHTTSSLSVYHATNSQMQFTNGTTGSADSNGFRVGHNGTQAQLYNFHNSDMGFATNNQQRMTIKAGGGVEIHDKAVLGTSTQTADGQNDVMLFATGIGGNAHSGDFHSKLRILGGGSQSRDLQLYQVDSEYAHIGSSWTSNQLTINSDFTQVNINPKVYMNAGTKDTGGGTATSNAALILQNGYLLIPGDETAIVFDEGQKMITVNDSQGNFHFKAGSDNDAIHVSTTSGNSGLCDINLDTDGTAGNINLAVGPTRAGGSSALLTAALNIAEGTNGLTWQTGSSASGTGITSNVHKVWHEGNDGSGSGLDADNLDGVTWGNINTTLQTSSNIKAYNGTTEIKSDGIYFESGNHCMTWNDGKGNFNIRMGHSPSEDVTETGYASHVEWSQSGGWMEISGTTSSRSAGTAITWANENVWTYTFSNGKFESPGDVVAYSSDRRLKTNIKNIDNALDKVLKLNGVHFDWADDIHERGFHGAEPGEKAVGVIAQEVEAVLPELVAPAPFDVHRDTETGEHLGSKSGEDYKTVKYEKLTALLIEAVKELSNKVDLQQEEIDRLKGL